MSAFTKAVVSGKFLEKNAERAFMVFDSIVYERGSVGSGLVIETPLNFETDFASVPQIMWTIFPPYGKVTKAAIVHDFLYKCLRENKSHWCASSYKEADYVFWEAMLVCGVKKWEANCMWFAVRCFSTISKDK
jgi:Protein of unknown function (DUF1353)